MRLATRLPIARVLRITATNFLLAPSQSHSCIGCFSLEGETGPGAGDLFKFAEIPFLRLWAK